MPHQCVKCNNIYKDGSEELLKGCSCGSRFFFYFRKEALEKTQKASFKLTKDEKDQMERDVFEMVGGDMFGKPVILDLESIRISKPGTYEISLVDIFGKKPLIYKVGEGKYVIDLVSVFEGKK
ncbi:Zn-ribbon domain-containing protein [archaeon]|nr:Zn-ribbon domain-containing protein [archaeon]